VSDRDQRGLAAPAAVVLVGVLLVVTVLAVSGGRLLVEHRRAAVAVDLAALAAATAVQHGHVGCQAASRFAELNGATLERCATHDQVVEVTVAVRSRLVLGGEVTLRSSARAGPVESRRLSRSAEQDVEQPHRALLVQRVVAVAALR